jgi:endoglucanase
MISAYGNLLKYWSGQGTAPTPDAALAALNAMAAYLSIDSCTYHPDVIDALLRQPLKTGSVPFATNTIPGTIYASNYDMGRPGSAYADQEYQNIAGQGNGSWNLGGEYRNDGVDIERSTDAVGNGYDVGWINTGEFLTFTVNVQTTDAYLIDLRVASATGGAKIVLNWDGHDLRSVVNVPSTGGLDQWQTVSVGPETLSVGTHTLAAVFMTGGLNLSSIRFTSASPGTSAAIDVFQNYPNPFSSMTTIQYRLAHDGRVAIEVNDVLGRKVAVMDRGLETGGNHVVKLDARSLSLSSSLYFYSVFLDGARSNVYKLTYLK